MLPYVVMETGSHEGWLQTRMKGIGGSDAASVIGVSPFKTNVQLFEEKTGQREPDDISDRPYVVYGTAAEPLIREMGGQNPGQLLLSDPALLPGDRMGLRGPAGTLGLCQGQGCAHQRPALLHRAQGCRGRPEVSGR